MTTVYVTNTSWVFWQVRVLLNCKSYKQWEVWGTGGWSPGQLSKRGPMWSPSKDWGSWSVLGSLLDFIEGQVLQLLQCTGSPDLCLKGDLRWKVNAESSAVAPLGASGYRNWFAWDTLYWWVIWVQLDFGECIGMDKPRVVHSGKISAVLLLCLQQSLLSLL